MQTLSSEIVQESDFSYTAYNFAYVRDVQSLIVKNTLQQFLAKFFRHKIEILGEIWNIQKTRFENFANLSVLSAHTIIINTVELSYIVPINHHEQMSGFMIRVVM